VAGTQSAASERRLARAAEKRRQRLIIFGALSGLAVVVLIIGTGLYVTQYRAPRAHVLSVGGRDYDAGAVARRGAYDALYAGGLGGDTILSIAQQAVDVLGDDEVLRLRAPVTVGVVTERDVRLELAEGFGVADSNDESAFDEAAFNEALRDVLRVVGVSRDEYFEIVSAEMLARRLRDGFRAEIEPMAQQIRLSRIRLTDPANAERVRHLALEEDADFAELTRENTADAGHRDDGGDLGWFTLSALGEALDGVLNAAPDADTASVVAELQPGEIAPVVASGIFFDIYMVTGREQDRDLDDGQIEQLVRRRFDAWVESERLLVQIDVDLSAGEARWIAERVGDQVSRALSATR